MGRALDDDGRRADGKRAVGRPDGLGGLGCYATKLAPAAVGRGREESMPPSATMKAVVLHGADDMHVEAWPRPAPGPGEVLLKVEVASICGTDVKVLHRTLQGQPAGEFVMGHEYAGTVVTRSEERRVGKGW